MVGTRAGSVLNFQLAHVLVNILAFHRNGTGHGFGLGSRVPLGGVLLRSLFAGGTAGGDQAGGAALPLGAVCGAGGGCAFAAAALCFGSCAAGGGACWCRSLVFAAAGSYYYYCDY